MEKPEQLVYQPLGERISYLINHVKIKEKEEYSVDRISKVSLACRAFMLAVLEMVKVYDICRHILNIKDIAKVVKARIRKVSNEG